MFERNLQRTSKFNGPTTSVNKMHLLCYFESSVQIYLINCTNVFGFFFLPS